MLKELSRLMVQTTVNAEDPNLPVDGMTHKRQQTLRKLFDVASPAAKKTN